MTLLACFAVALIIEGILYRAFGSNYVSLNAWYTTKSVHMFGFYLPDIYLIGFGLAVLAIAALSDAKVVYSGGISGAPRIARHLWRMCLGLTLAVGSAFTNGLARILPGPYHVPLYLHLPKLLPLGLLVFWLIRVRFTNWYSKDAPTFDNTLVALERSGQTLARVSHVFHALTSANSNDVLQQLQQEIAPQLAAHDDTIHLNGKLFARIEAVHAGRDRLALDAESLRLVEFQHQQFVLAGARLSAPDKGRLKALNEEDASLSARFITQLLAASKDGALRAQPFRSEDLGHQSILKTDC